MNKFLKILFLSFILIFGVSSCQDTNNGVVEKNNIVSEKKLIKTDNLKKIENIEFCEQFIKKGKYYKVWSDTKPAINKTHIFCGEYNSRGKPTGFHSMPDGKNPKTVKIIKIENKNKLGVYNANIGVYDIKNKYYKNKFSSIFPDNLSMQDIEKIILNAWKNKKYYKNSKFMGPSGLGFDISGYTYKGENKINTAYPIYKK